MLLPGEGQRPPFFGRIMKTLKIIFEFSIMFPFYIIGYVNGLIECGFIFGKRMATIEEEEV